MRAGPDRPIVSASTGNFGHDQLHAAEAELRAATGITVEGAAAASWAGLLADAATDTRRAGAAFVILTGSNGAA